jgi:hypothetical protein
MLNCVEPVNTVQHAGRCVAGAWTKKPWFSQGVRRPCDKSLRLEAANGGKFTVAKGDKMRQVRCRILPQFVTGADAARFVGRMAKGMVSSKNCPEIWARQPRKIRLAVQNRSTSWVILYLTDVVLKPT